MAKTRTAAGWDALSPTYRTRLQRGGITRAGYLRGDSLKTARGKGKGPEHPKDAIRNPRKYPSYRPQKNPAGLEPAKQGEKKSADRRELEKQFVQNVQRQMGDRIKWSTASDVAIQESATRVTYTQLIAGINANEQDLEDWGTPQNESESVMGPFYPITVKGRRMMVNPFWYHGDPTSGSDS